MLALCECFSTHSGLWSAAPTEQGGSSITRICDIPECCVQTIVDGFQHEQPDYWLNFGNPWEIERLNVGYPIKFYGHVSVHEEDGRQIFRWNPGEAVGLVCLNSPSS